MAGEDDEYLPISRLFLSRLHIWNCPMQFAHLYSFQTAPGSTSRGRNTYIRFCFALLPGTEWTACRCLLGAEQQVYLRQPEFMKDEFEAAAIKAINQ